MYKHTYAHVHPTMYRRIIPRAHDTHAHTHVQRTDELGVVRACRSTKNLTNLYTAKGQTKPQIEGCLRTG